MSPRICRIPDVFKRVKWISWGQDLISHLKMAVLSLIALTHRNPLHSSVHSTNSIDLSNQYLYGYIYKQPPWGLVISCFPEFGFLGLFCSSNILHIIKSHIKSLLFNEGFSIPNPDGPFFQIIPFITLLKQHTHKHCETENIIFLRRKNQREKRMKRMKSVF